MRNERERVLDGFDTGIYDTCQHTCFAVAAVLNKIPRFSVG
jgi:hypothetical protein